jgi:CRP/FNR family cyclic AMP-dependent transcriptional regulator
MDQFTHVSLFTGLSEQVLAAINSVTTSRSYNKNTVIINEGDLSSSMYLLVSGKVKVYLSDEEGKEFVLSTLGPGAYFGELALLDDEKRTASVKTVEDSVFKCLHKDDLMKLQNNFPEVSQTIISNLVKIIRSLTENIKSLALKDVYGRIRRLLMDMAETTNPILEKLTQQDIASRVGSSREMVARILKDLAAGGYITIEKKQIHILKPLPFHY